MKGYKENQEKGKQLFEQRKAEMVSKALSDTKEKKEKLKKQLIIKYESCSFNY